MTLFRKVLFAFCALSLIPLAFLAFTSGRSLRTFEAQLSQESSRALDQQAARMLKMRAEMLSSEIEGFLEGVVSDLHTLSLLPPTEDNYLRFSRSHQREIWYRAGENGAPLEIRESVPLYSEIAFIQPDGLETLRIRNDEVSRDLRDLSDIANTTYLTETYFSEALRLPPGEIYVSHLTGWHIDKEEQLGEATSPATAVEGKVYTGVIRWAKPVHGPQGRLRGVVVLSLDHRHLMEFTQHILSTEDRRVVFPVYAEGNYAFLFDDEGWIITHPKYWDIRGLDASGRLLPPYTKDSLPEDVQKGRIPYNLLHAGFIHPNYPGVAREVFQGRSGVADVTNVGGAQKIMAYAPIRFDHGGYSRLGVFGGVTIGAEIKTFHRPAVEASGAIRKQIAEFVRRSWLLISVTALTLIFVAYWLAKGITDPLHRLTEGTRRMARGALSEPIPVRSEDEVGTLARSFNTMAGELGLRRARLLRSLQALRRSKREILKERNFKETVFENIQTGILTLDAEGRVTSINSPGSRILHLQRPTAPISICDLLSSWPEILHVLDGEMGEPICGTAGIQYVDLKREEETLCFRLAHLPLSGSEGHGSILTIEDVTEQVKLRQRMARMERLVSLGRLSAGIAHEVRNPLTGISLLLDDLHDRLLASPGEQRLIRSALQEIERLENLVNELLDFAVISSKSLVPGDVNEILRQTILLIEKQYERAGIEMELALCPELPSFPMESAKLKQAFLNLFTNALDAMGDGGRLRIVTKQAGDTLEVVFEDSGKGIAQEDLPLIFEPFFTAKAEGTGLGLSITHNIISEHGGCISVESQPGAGATFSLRFPLPDKGRPARSQVAQAG